MIQTLLIVWRESLEAALVVGILLTYLGRSGEREGVRYVWSGAAAALAIALLCAVASGDVIGELSGDAQELLQAGILFVAVAVLTWMVVWMHGHARGLRGDIERRAGAALATGRRFGLAVIAFVAVFREGMETVLFLWGVAVQRATTGALPLVGAGFAGAVLAVLTAMLFFRGFAYLNLATFFRVTGVLLLLVAAGLLSSGVNKLIGLGLVSPLVPQLWNTAWLIRDNSVLGAVLGALVGYRSRPSLLEVLAFVCYFPPMLWALRRARGPAPSPRHDRGSALPRTA
jgi:high-affinity iron transporter